MIGRNTPANQPSRTPWLPSLTDNKDSLCQACSEAIEAHFQLYWSSVSTKTASAGFGHLPVRQRFLETVESSPWIAYQHVSLIHTYQHASFMHMPGLSVALLYQQCYSIPVLGAPSPRFQLLRLGKAVTFNPSVLQSNTCDTLTAHGDCVDIYIIMDPFSITVGLTSLLSFSGSCARNLRRVVHNARYAPDEILAISNEVSDINLLLSDIEATNKALENPGVQTEANVGFYRGLSEQLLSARSKFGQLEGLVADLYTVLPDNRTKFSRYAWVRKKSTAVSLQQDLVNMKRNLGLLLNAAAAYVA